MRKLVFLLVLALVAAGVVAGPIPGGLIHDPEVNRVLSVEVSNWAANPVSLTACARTPGPDSCCVLKTDCAGTGTPMSECEGLNQGPFADNTNQCIEMAKTAITNPGARAREIYACVRKDGDFACEIGTQGTSQTMHCTVMPGVGSEALILEVVSKCLSGQAATQFAGVT